METVKHRLKKLMVNMLWSNLGIIEAPLKAASIVFSILGSRSDHYDLCINDHEYIVAK